MNRTISKIIRKAIAIFDGDSVAQELSDGSADEAEIDEKIISFARKAASSGAVLLKNDGVLPIKNGETVSVFGRCASDWFAVGYGSGGDVVTPYKTSLIQGLKNSGVCLNEEVQELYNKWRSEPKNQPDDGFWGHWPFAYDEMPLSEDVVKSAAEKSDLALVVIGRAAGEDRENKLKKGSYYLTDSEVNMLGLVTKHFNRSAVVLDIGNIIDFSEIDRLSPEAVLIAWQGGMESGNAVADVLTGAVTPSGKLSDTIAAQYTDYPSSSDFGNDEYNDYTEDIYVGYRYFESFAKGRVLYPFGFGLSYTLFSLSAENITKDGLCVSFDARIKNIGEYSGSETVQVYVCAPQGLLGKPVRVLSAFAKSDVLLPGEEQIINLSVNLSDAASFDDSAVTGFKCAFVLEDGRYDIYFGNSVRECNIISSVDIADTVCVQQLSDALGVRSGVGFKRMVNRGGIRYEKVPEYENRIVEKVNGSLPENLIFSGDRGYKLSDVAEGLVSLDAFVSQLNLDELEAISRGEGKMDSALGAKGNAGAYGGVTLSLRDKGIPPVITTDGPAGIRLKKKCSLLPCGTLLACTWDTKLIKELYSAVGEEMLARGSDVLLAPGMNIHRNPLCGRNFEYYSEDPYLSGKMAAAVVSGIQQHGISACPKHFACNNQETNRTHNDSRVSPRALREIYLRGFEICVKEARPKNLMTSYNKINGVWSHYNFELCEEILRGEWGYDGNIITDWWMRYSRSPEFPAIRDNAYRVRAGVDVLMPGGKGISGKKCSPDGSLLESYRVPGGITLGEMQRTAKNVLNSVLKIKFNKEDAR